MANPKIEVEIGAKVEGLTAGVNTATGQLDKLGKSAAATAPQIQKLTQASQGYNSVGVDFARIIQDAPFGIIGVGNNITQLAGSFQVLKNTTGSTSAALKSAFGSIFSSGNALILGISLLTTAFTILQQKGFFKTEEDAKSLDEALKEYQDTLTGVAAATLKGAQDAQKELSVLKSLEIQATNTAVSTDKRLQAVEQLQKQYPDYFGNLTKEQILNGQVGDAYLKVAANLLAKAKAQAATNQIAENGIELLRIETKLEDQKAQRLLKTAQAQAQVDALIEKRQKEGFLTQGDLQRYDTLIKSINTANKSLSEEATLSGEIARINKENTQLTEQITKQIEAGATFTKDKATAGKAVNTEKEKELKIEDELIGRVELGNQLRDDANKKVEQLALSLLDVQKVGKNLDLSEGITITPEIADIDDSKKSAFITSLKEFNDEASRIITSGAVQGLGDIGYAIGEALANGGNVVKAAGKALLGGIATIAENLGQAAIKIGVTMIGIKLAFKNPATAIAAGVALIALAGFIRAKVGGGGGGGGITSGIGGGGGGGGSSVGDSGVGGGSSFTGGGQGGLFQQNKDLNGELVVRGQDLVYVFGQANNRINKG